MTGIPLTALRNASEDEATAYRDEAVTAAYEQAWTRDVLALNAELTHALITLTHRAHGGKQNTPPLRIMRPGEIAEENQVERMSWGDFAVAMKAQADE